MEGFDHRAMIERVGIDVWPTECPSPSGYSIVHGDYRLDNMVLDDDGPCGPFSTGRSARWAIRMADLGLMHGLLDAARRRCRPAGDAHHRARVLPPRAELLERYAAASGLDLSASTSTWPSATGSWPASCRASMPAMPAAPVPATPAASRSTRPDRPPGRPGRRTLDAA